jgi:tRNA threonylcarbamoyladenosine biosynthesis protein TsaE
MQVAESNVLIENVSKDELPEAARQVLQHTQHLKVWLLVGEMGAGKTTLAKELCRQLGVTDAMSSPTFSIVNEYRTHTGNSIFHFDFYRLQREQEAIDIGVEEYFYSGAYCFIEWPERIPNLLPERYAVLKIDIVDIEHRTLSVTLHG